MDYIKSKLIIKIFMNKSPNYSKATRQKIGYIIHGTLGKFEGAVDWLCTPPEKRPVVSYSSAHYVIAKDGRYEQLVDKKDVSWHAGNISNPTERAKSLLLIENGKYVNPNELFIGIELEWFKGDEVTEEQYKKVVEIINKGGIINPKIMCHKELTDYKVDFENADGTLNYKIVQEINRRLGGNYSNSATTFLPAHYIKLMEAVKEFQLAEHIMVFANETDMTKVRLGPATQAAIAKYQR